MSATSIPRVKNRRFPPICLAPKLLAEKTREFRLTTHEQKIRTKQSPAQTGYKWVGWGMWDWTFFRKSSTHFQVAHICILFFAAYSLFFAYQYLHGVLCISFYATHVCISIYIYNSLHLFLYILFCSKHFNYCWKLLLTNQQTNQPTNGYCHV